MPKKNLQPLLSKKRSVAEIFEIGGDAEVAAAHELNHSLQVVLLFSGDPNLSILQLALHFETLRLDRLDDLFRFVFFEALPNFYVLAGMTTDEIAGSPCSMFRKSTPRFESLPITISRNPRRWAASSAVRMILSFSARISAVIPLKSKRVASSLRA